MEPIRFDAAETYEPDPDWERRALAGGEDVSLEWFSKPPGHASPMHDHENGQVCLVLAGELTVHTEDDAVTMERYDSVWLDPWEPHAVENTGDELAVGLDIFVPGRSFDFWLDRE